jgi:cytochrome c556
VAAEAIAKHPLVSDAERTSIQGVLGEDMPNFAKGDKAVHDTAMAMSEAAKAQDMALVLARNAQLQSECVACHTNFRDRLADR